MTDMIEKTLNRLGQQPLGPVSLPGDERYAAAMSIWAKPAYPDAPRRGALPHIRRCSVGDCDVPALSARRRP